MRHPANWLSLSGVCRTLLFGVGCNGADVLLPEVSKLTGLLKEHLIAKVDILHVPYATETRAAVDPVMLARMGTHCEIPVDAEISNELQRAIREENVRPAASAGDLRWGLFFQTTANQTVATIYLDSRYITGTGRQGMIDGRVVDFNGKLARWAEVVTRAKCPTASL